MASDSFQFKQFTIQQSQCAMKVGTDGVLLGAWADCDPRGDAPVRVLDIGTGTGIIALMMAQRIATTNADFQIDAVEIDAEAAAQASVNFQATSWAEKIHLYPHSLKDFARVLSEQGESSKYDLIVSNPPFYNATLKPEDQGRAVARHKDSLPVEEIARFARERLTETGRLALIYPSDYDTEVMTAAVLSGLHPVRLCDLVTKVGKPAKRRMAEFCLSGSTPQRELLAIRDEAGKYTAEYRHLTEDFYLHLTD